MGIFVSKHAPANGVSRCNRDSTSIIGQETAIERGNTRNSIDNGMISDASVMETQEEGLSASKSGETELDNDKEWHIKEDERKLNAGSSSHGVTKTRASLQDSNNKDADDIHSNIWFAIDAGLEGWNARNRKRPPLPTSPDWRVIRLFVSSTFTDFYAEREVLVKRVVPAINSWCMSRKIQLIECDLRWGIPKETTANDTVNICMREIEKCLADTGGQAFFINMLGDRYGWIPDLRQIKSETVLEYDLIQGLSITHTEILQAALRSSSRNAAFFIRDSQFISELPADMKPSFVEPTFAGKRKLAELKNQLRKRFPGQVFEYNCNYNAYKDQESGTSDVNIKRLEYFADTAIDFFKNAIEKFYPNQERDLSEEELYFLYQDGFIEKKCALLVGRDKEVGSIIDFIHGSDVATESQSNYCFVTGPSGIGKSSLLAQVVRYVKSSGLKSVYNFASATTGSMISSIVTEVFTKTLMSSNGETVEEFENLSHEAKKEKYKEMVEKIGRDEEQIIFVFDAVNQFSDVEASSLFWLPSELKGKAKCIVGCTESSPLMGLIKAKLSSIPFEEIQLKGFDQISSEEFVKAAFARYSKKLDDQQMQKLIAKNESFNPLWLSLACEELRIFGVFELLNSKIEGLPGQLENLVTNVVERLIDEDETGSIKDIACFLVCSTAGLTTTELRWSCGDGKEPLPIFLWEKCHLLLQPYLLIVGKRRGEENLAFCHDSFNIAIRKSLLLDETVKRSYHSKLAASLDTHCNDDVRVASELPVQLKLAKDFTSLLDFFRKDKRSMKVSSIHKSFYLRECRCQKFVGGANDRFSAPVYICNICSTRLRAFSPMPFLNKDSCLICGTNVPFKNNNSIAYVCMNHKDHTAPDTTKCWVCKTIIFLKQKGRMSFNQMYLCQQCASRGQKCVKLNT